MRTLRVPLGLAAAFLLSSPWPSQAQTPFSLSQALDLAEAHSPVLAAAAKEIAASEAALLQAGLRRNPELSTSVEDWRTRYRSTTATVGLPLELGGKREARVAAAERARDLARAELAFQRAQLRAQVIGSYFQVLLAQERRVLSQASVEIARRAAEAVGQRVRAGRISPVEETRARIDQANAELEALDAQTELQVARQGLALAMGEGVPRLEPLPGDLAAAPARPALAELLPRLESSPALALGRAQTERRRALLALERSKARPDLLLSLGAKRNNEQGLTQAVIGLSMPLPVFDRNQGAILEAAHRVDQAGDEQEALRLRLRAELQEARQRLDASDGALQLLQTTVLPSAERAYDAARQGLEAGKFGFLEVLDAQRSLFQARARYLNTLSGAHQAAAVIDRIVGPQTGDFHDPQP